MYSNEQIEELRVYEQAIRNKQVKSLCNAAQVTKMRMIVRNLIDHIDQSQANRGCERAE